MCLLCHYTLSNLEYYTRNLQHTLLGKQVITGQEHMQEKLKLLCDTWNQSTGVEVEFLPKKQYNIYYYNK